MTSDSTSGRSFSSNFFQYSDYITTEHWYTGFNMLQLCERSYQRIKAYSNTQSITYSGSHTGYSVVSTESQNNNVSGLTIQRFLDISDIIDPTFPYPPAEDNEHLRGLPTETLVLKYNNQALFPVLRTKYIYSVANISDFASGVKVADDNICTYEPQYYLQAEAQRPLPQSVLYQVHSALTLLIQKNEKVYDQADTTKFSETVTNYEYAPNHFQLNLTSFTNSEGELVKVRNYYPPDISLTGSAETARVELVSKNKLSDIIKQEELNNSNIIRESGTYYKIIGNKLFPEEIYEKIGSSNLISKVKFLEYNSTGNLLSQQKLNDLITTYIWDYNASYPIAEITNANNNSVAYTSFEADGKGNWSFSGTPSTDLTAITGRKVYNPSLGQISKTIVAAGTYVISYWSKNGQRNVNSTTAIQGSTKSGWTLFMHHVTIGSGGTVTVSGSGIIDELRLYPNTSQMTTYTYTPLLGLTSQSDPNNRINYYEYDAFGRLFLIKDLDRNIVKKICYNYQGQVEDCGVPIWLSVSVSSNYYKQNCPTGQIANPYFVSIPYGTYTSTVSQQAANDLATQAAQNQANLNGTCRLPSVYAKLSYENYSWTWAATYADVIVRFYSDMACTQSVSVSGLILNLAEEGYTSGNHFSYDFSQTTSTGTSHMVQPSSELLYNDGMTESFRDFYLLGGVGYTVVY